MFDLLIEYLSYCHEDVDDFEFRGLQNNETQTAWFGWGYHTYEARVRENHLTVENEDTRVVRVYDAVIDFYEDVVGVDRPGLVECILEYAEPKKRNDAKWGAA